MGGRAGSVLIITSMVRNPGSPTHSNRGQDAEPQVVPDAFIGQKTFLKTEMASFFKPGNSSVYIQVSRRRKFIYRDLNLPPLLRC